MIHMNGRAYDYNLGRFLSVDPFIQAPGNSQSMNPYSYIMNNPLAGTDPSGYRWTTIWDSATGTLEELTNILGRLGFDVDVRNGTVNLNRETVNTNWQSLSEILSPAKIEEINTNAAISRVSRQLRKLGIAVSGTTSQKEIEAKVRAISGQYEVSGLIVEDGNTYQSISAIDSAVESDKDSMSSEEYSVNLLKVLSGYNALSLRQIENSRNSFSRSRILEGFMYRNMDASQKEALLWVSGLAAPAAVALLPEGVAGYLGVKSQAFGSWFIKNKNDVIRACVLVTSLCNANKDLRKPSPGVSDAYRRGEILRQIEKDREALKRLNDHLRDIPTKVHK